MNLSEAFGAYRDIARAIIIKSDMLRLGQKWSKAALESVRKRKDIDFKGYSLFSFDFGEPVMINAKIPRVIYLDDGTEDGTCLQVRTTDDSPYLIDFVDGEYKVYWNNEEVAKIGAFEQKPRFYSRTLEDGTPFEAYLFRFGRDGLFLMANKYCEYFSKGLQCLFCDVVPFAAAQKKAGEAMVARKHAERAAEVLDVAFHERGFRHLTVSGGSFIWTKYQGKNEVEWMADFLNTIRRRIRCWYGAAVQLTALDDEGWKRIYDTGIPTVQPNIEVWDKRLFGIMCPGKNEAVGYDEWIKRTINAVKYWGPGNVNPSFVMGVEMAQPFGFKNWQDAVKSTLSGHDFLMSNGVVPRQGSFWVAEANSKLAGYPPPPLEYFLEIGKGYLELREKYGFNPPVINCRHCANHMTEWDFEYFHGHGVASKEAEEKSSIMSYGSAGDEEVMPIAY